MCFRSAVRSLIVPLMFLLLAGCRQAETPGVTITWSTASEFNTAGFVIERSDTADGPFERVSSFLPSGDDPFVAHEYQFIDRSVQPGRIYYFKLITVHNDNSHSESGRLSAEAR